MTAARYRECLELLGLSQNDIARILGCFDRLARWTSGRIAVPTGIAKWLER